MIALPGTASPSASGQATGVPGPVIDHESRCLVPGLVKGRVYVGIASRHSREPVSFEGALGCGRRCATGGGAAGG